MTVGGSVGGWVGRWVECRADDCSKHHKELPKYSHEVQLAKSHLASNGSNSKFKPPN